MKINKANALKLWEEYYGTALWAKDFHGNLMYKDAYGNDESWAFRGSTTSSYRFGYAGTVLWSSNNKIYCGWNLHHVLPIAKGGTNAQTNLICTNIITNEEAEDKITFWIDDCNYQVKRKPETSTHEIIRLN